MRRRRGGNAPSTDGALVELLAQVEAEAARLYPGDLRGHNAHVHDRLAEHGTDVVECYRARRWLRRVGLAP